MLRTYLMDGSLRNIAGVNDNTSIFLQTSQLSKTKNSWHLKNLNSNIRKKLFRKYFRKSKFTYFSIRWIRYLCYLLCKRNLCTAELSKQLTLQKKAFLTSEIFFLREVIPIMQAYQLIYLSGNY